MGPDGTSPWVLKMCAPELAPSLTRLFKRSLPQGWRTAHVTPIHKGNSKSDPNNYRPISLLPIVSKVLERIINKRIQRHLLQHNLVSHHQFGFLPGRSTLDLIASVTQRWADALDKQQEVRVVALDISRAFDRVWHRGLLAKLVGCRISGGVLHWIEAFLSGRRQAVVLNGQKSTYRPTNAGVPQGSVLGPTLFLVFINDIFKQVQSKLDLFSDDSTLHHSISKKSDRQAVAAVINRDLENLARWAASWCISFNANKTKVITISRARDADRNHPQLVFQGQRLAEESSLTIVGVTINKTLNWDDHIHAIAQRAGQRSGALVRCSSVLPPSASLSAYKNFVRSTMEYCSPVWAGAAACHLSLLDRVQRRALWACCIDPDNISLCNELAVQTLGHRRAVASLCVLHRMITGVAPQPLTSLCPDYHTALQRTRSAAEHHNYHLTEHRSRTGRHRASFLPSTVGRWNGLAPTVLARHPQSLQGFKNSVNAALLTTNNR